MIRHKHQEQETCSEQIDTPHFQHCQESDPQLIKGPFAVLSGKLMVDHVKDEYGQIPCVLQQDVRVSVAEEGDHIGVATRDCRDEGSVEGGNAAYRISQVDCLINERPQTYGGCSQHREYTQEMMALLFVIRTIHIKAIQFIDRKAFIQVF